MILKRQVSCLSLDSSVFAPSKSTAARYRAWTGNACCKKRLRLAASGLRRNCAPFGQDL